MRFPKFRKLGRYAACILLVAALFLLYELRLFQWQIIDVEKYQQQSLDNRTDSIEVEPARGQLLDRGGKVLAGNRTSYDIVYDALEMVYEERNATIVKIIDLLTERGEKWRDLLPIVVDEEGQYQFAPEKEDAVASLKSNLNLADYATAADCIRELAESYNFEGYSTEDTRNVASVLYSMVRDGYSRTNPYVIAQDVSPETVGVISQRAAEWPGIKAQVAVTRYYGEDGSLAPHVVGHTGLIQDYQLEAAEEKGQLYDYADNISGYKNNDVVGRSGLELAFEEELRGKRGEKTIYNDDTGSVKEIAVTTQPEEGNTVYTTLDSDLQRVANLSLKKNILGNTLAKDCIAGAAVALDVNDFGVLACSSYPTFDMNRYIADDSYFNQINSDNDNKPGFNRALDGAFAPGSVFKPMVALAALQEGVISSSTSFFCNGLYTLGDDAATALNLKCTGIHENANVYGALAGSCNVFFCNVGVDLTIKKMDAYAKYFGLGEKTGVEIGEATGQMSNPQEYFENHGEEWLDGASAQTAIGQADNMFTPIQLAAYCATMANGGKRLETHFLQKITDYSGQEVLEEYQPKELYDAGLSSDVLGIVREGMIGVGSYGTAEDVFSNYPVAVACKTGTAETTRDPDAPDATEANISFICYAPANDPEIAVAVMLEHGHKGDYAQRVAKDILDQYFGFYTWDEDGNRYDQEGNLVDDEGKVLKTKAQLDQEKAQAQAAQSQEDGDPSSAPESGSQTPEPSPDRDGDIPTVPYTGESSSPPESAAPTGSPRPTDSPYHTGTPVPLSSAPSG